MRKGKENGKKMKGKEGEGREGKAREKKGWPLTMHLFFVFQFASFALFWLSLEVDTSHSVPLNPFGKYQRDQEYYVAILKYYNFTQACAPCASNELKDKFKHCAASMDLFPLSP